ncbi:MAG: glycosyltransferase, partial [Bacteroidales bacterium]|nr:glycosyltransferase [Bacteroidales bacterium]
MEISTCQFNDSYFPIMDGVGMSVHNYAHWLNRKYGKTSLVAPKVKGYKDLAEYSVYRFKSVLLPGMNPYRVGLPLIDTTFKRKIKEKHFDLLHAHCPFVSGQLAMKLSEKLDVPLVATFHTKYREDFKRVLNNELMEEFLIKYTLDFYHQADHLWVPNKATGITLKEYGYQGNYEVVQNGTDMEVPEKSKLLKYRQRGLAKVGIDGKKFMMLFVGQLRWEKNVKMIIEALRILNSLDKDFIMVFIGEGYAASGI